MYQRIVNNFVGSRVLASESRKPGGSAKYRILLFLQGTKLFQGTERPRSVRKLLAVYLLTVLRDAEQNLSDVPTYVLNSFVEYWKIAKIEEKW